MKYPPFFTGGSFFIYVHLLFPYQLAKLDRKYA